MGAHGWLAGFASHRNETQSRGWLAGFQWKPLDIRGTQPPFQDVVVKCNLPKLTTKLGAAQIDSAVIF